MKESEYLTWFLQLERIPENRFTVLEEVQKVLGFREVEWKCLLNVFRKAEFGMLHFNLGNITVALTRSEEEEKLHLYLEWKKEKMEKSVIYTYSLTELETLRKKKQLKISEMNGW
ncbi:MAG: hypothetical protein QMD13_03765 [Candidatus Bathyarchaeia archaeon]|nr:hypothetical protein [Candidatus Bathyarchaeia archaeon]